MQISRRIRSGNAEDTSWRKCLDLSTHSAYPPRYLRVSSATLNSDFSPLGIDFRSRNPDALGNYYNSHLREFIVPTPGSISIRGNPSTRRSSPHTLQRSREVWKSALSRSQKIRILILRLRLGERPFRPQTLFSIESIDINGIKFSLHPAGHILGPAQERVKSKWRGVGGQRQLQDQDDGVSVPFEVVKVQCPHYKVSIWITRLINGRHRKVVMGRDPRMVEAEGIKWTEKASVIIRAMRFGKMRRLIVNLQPFIGPVFAHGAISPM